MITGDCQQASLCGTKELDGDDCGREGLIQVVLKVGILVNQSSEVRLNARESR